MNHRHCSLNILKFKIKHQSFGNKSISQFRQLFFDMSSSYTHTQKKSWFRSKVARLPHYLQDFPLFANIITTTLTNTITCDILHTPIFQAV